MKIVPMSASLINHMGDDLSVVNAARVSFHKESTQFSESDAKLIAYLAKHKHYSPFNHTFVSFRVKAPIFVARQLVKHEYLPWNEVSRRYVSDDPEFHEIQFRWAAENVKQGSGGAVDALTQAKAENIFWESVDISLKAYTDLLALGIAAEQARAVLPTDTMTEWIWSGTLKAFAKMLKLRLDPHAQKEAQEITLLIRDQILPHFPVSLPALLESDIE